MDRNTNSRVSVAGRGEQRRESPAIDAIDRAIKERMAVAGITRDKTESSFRTRAFRLIATVLVVALIALTIWWFLGRSNIGTTIAEDRYQAVFFTNGQVYFGKLQTINQEYFELSDVFYIQSQAAEADSENPQKTNANPANDIQLIKLGSEVHGPEDSMIVSRDQVLFFENMKKDGTVSKSITKYKETKKN